jgi:3-hydroxyacyl-[acyl-carrier-protein] dehydratase
MGPMQIQEIMDTVPHRYPILLIDRVDELVPNGYIKAIKNVSVNEPIFQGHFPGNPIMPGVLMLEAMAQAMAILAIKTIEHELQKDEKGSIFYFAGIDKARFKRPVLPGDQLELNVQLLKHKGQIWKAQGRARVGDELACEAELLAAYKG